MRLGLAPVDLIDPNRFANHTHTHTYMYTYTWVLFNLSTWTAVANPFVHPCPLGVSCESVVVDIVPRTAQKFLSFKTLRCPVRFVRISFQIDFWSFPDLADFLRRKPT